MDGDIEDRLEQVAGLLDGNRAALDATRAGLAEVIDALAGGGLTAVRLAQSLANLDGLITVLRASATGLEGLTAAVSATAGEIREVRRRERQRCEEEARHEGVPRLRAVASA